MKASRFFKLSIIIFFTLFVFVFAAKDKKSKKKYKLKGKEVLKAKKIYKKHCTQCHQSRGQGLKKVYPPLKGSEWLKKDKETLIKIVLHGLEGDIIVKGKKYNNKMLQLGSQMKDAEIAKVLMYVRQAWKNKYSSKKITAKDVAKVRKKYSKRKTRWTVKELEKKK